MYKKLALLVASLVCVSLMAAPVKSKKMQRESLFLFQQKAEQTTPAKAPVVVPQSHRERSTTEPMSWKTMQAQLKNVAKVPVVSNDTLFITEDDLPYVADMRLSTTAVVALQLSQAKELVVSVSADLPYPLCGLQINGSWLSTNGYTLIHEWPAGQVAVQPIAMHDYFCGYPCKLAISVADDNNIVTDITDLTVDTITSLPFKAAETAPQAVKYLYTTASGAFKFYAPLAAKAFYYKAPKDMTYAIAASDVIYSLDAALNLHTDGESAVNKDVTAGDAAMYVVRSTDGAFTFDMKEGQLPYYQLIGVSEVKEVQLPFRYEGTLSHAVASGMSTGVKYDAYQFQLDKQARLRVYNSQSVYLSVSLADGSTISLSYGTSDVLEPGSYTVLCSNDDNIFAAADYCLFIDTVDVAAAALPLYDTMSYDESLTVGKTAYGTIARNDGRLVLLGSDDSAAGFAKGFEVELEPGCYRATLTVSGDADMGKSAVVAVYSQLTGNLADDTVALAVNNYVYDNQHQTSCSVVCEFTINKAGTYYVAIADWFDDCSNDYALMVEKYVPEHFTEITLPFAAENVSYDPADAGSYFGYPAVGYVFSVPQDTLVEVSLQSDSYDCLAVITPSLKQSPIVEVPSGGTLLVPLTAGYWYLPVVEFNKQQTTFGISLEYSDKSLTTDTITLDSLLRAAKVVEAVENDALFLGAKPTELVEDIKGKMRYAYAYNMALDSGECVRFTRTCEFDEYLFVYRATADTFELWNYYDDDFPLIEADSTTNYYFVVSSYSACETGNITLSLTKVAKDKLFPVDSVLSRAIDITLPYHVEGEFSDASADLYDDGFYRQVYRVQLTKESRVEFRMQAEQFSNYVYPRIEVYNADSNMVRAVDGGYTISYVYAVDSTAYHYVVLTTDEAGGEGTYQFDAHVVEAKKQADLAADAIVLEQMSGTRTADKPQFNADEGSSDCWYNLELDSAQVFLCTLNSFRNIGSIDVYKKVGETMTDVSYSSLYGNAFWLQADAVATYYLRISLSSSFETLMFDYKKTLNQLPISEVDSYLRLNGAFDIENDHFVYAMQPSLATDMYCVHRNAGEGLALIRRHTRGDFALHITGAPAMGSDGVQNLPDASAAVTDSLLLLSDWNTVVIDRSDYDFLLHTTLPLDTILTHASELDFATLPLNNKGVVDQLFAENAWYYDGTDNAAVLGAYKVDMKAGQQLQFNGAGGNPYQMYVYTYDGAVFTKCFEGGSSNMSFWSSAANTYYILLLMPVSVDVFDILDNAYNYTLQNPLAVTEITAVAADCASVETDDIESETAVRMALNELHLTMTAANGTVIDVVNKSSAWVLDTKLTKADYTVSLPEGYIFADGVNPTVTVLVNPAKVKIVASEHGTVSPAGSKVVRRNSSVTLDIAADEGYVVAAVKVNDEPVSCDVVGKKSGEFTFVAKRNMTVEVTFRLATAIDQVLTQRAVVYTQQRTLIVDGVELGTDIRIYTLTGALISAGKATSTTQAYTMPTSGLYIVRIGMQVEKAICK
ncbi:MAG: hypothetical protein SO182_00405 [Paludibacteraceae bacterium]|nr:hypothetical protein [Paludibacteraceae bacterium]